MTESREQRTSPDMPEPLLTRPFRPTCNALLRLIAATTGTVVRGNVQGLIPASLANCRKGAALIEFAIVAPVFLAIVFATLETGLAFFAQQTLQTAASQAARLIMTGQAQNQGLTASQFQHYVCQHLSTSFNCANVYVNIQTFSSFSSVSMLNPVQNNSFDSSKMAFSPGGPGDIEVVQVFYQWPVMLAPLGFDLANVGGNKRLLVGTAAFRNEPYIQG